VHKSTKISEINGTGIETEAKEEENKTIFYNPG